MAFYVQATGKVDVVTLGAGKDYTCDGTNIFIIDLGAIQLNIAAIDAPDSFDLRTMFPLEQINLSVGLLNAITDQYLVVVDAATGGNIIIDDTNASSVSQGTTGVSQLDFNNHRQDIGDHENVDLAGISNGDYMKWDTTGTPTFNANKFNFVQAHSIPPVETTGPYVGKYIWKTTHNLGRFPSITAITSGGDEVEGDIIYQTSNEVWIVFNAGISGTVYLT